MEMSKNLNFQPIHQPFKKWDAFLETVDKILAECEILPVAEDAQ